MNRFICSIIRDRPSVQYWDTKRKDEVPALKQLMVLLGETDNCHAAGKAPGESMSKLCGNTAEGYAT